MENNINRMIKNINEYFESSGKSHFQGDIWDHKENEENRNISIIIANPDEELNSYYSIPIPFPVLSELASLMAGIFIINGYKIFINLKNDEHTPSPDIYIESEYEYEYNNMKILIFMPKEQLEKWKQWEQEKLSKQKQ